MLKLNFFYELTKQAALVCLRFKHDNANNKR